MSEIIFLNGTSSSGKTSISKCLKDLLPIPFLHLASDQFVEAGVLPKRVNDGGPFDWSINRPKFFDGFHLCLKSFADSGNNLIIDHIIESQKWYNQLELYFSRHTVFKVGIYCPVEILRQRENDRKDKEIGKRYIGESEFHLKHVHTYGKYNFEIDSSKQTPLESARIIMTAYNDFKIHSGV